MGMRCKKHPFQAGGGVCATCLRERLFTLAAAQNGGASSPPLPPRPAHAAPPEAVASFPRSVSPYVSRRKSDASLRQHPHPSLLFFRTPQVGPAGSGALEEGDIAYEHEKRRAGKFSVLATLFGAHHHGHHHRSDDKDGAKERKKHSSWFAGIIPRRRKKQQAPEPASAAALPASPPPARRACRVLSNRGLSPERDDDESSSPAESDPPWRPSPSPMRKTPGRRRQTGSSMPSGFAVCLSPLVRPSPGRRHRGAAQPPDPCSFSCELRPSPLHNLSSAAAASITRCRSKKLADAGRFR